jgi:hypothetical protein
MGRGLPLTSAHHVIHRAGRAATLAAHARPGHAFGLNADQRYLP